MPSSETILPIAVSSELDISRYGHVINAENTRINPLAAGEVIDQLQDATGAAYRGQEMIVIDNAFTLMALALHSADTPPTTSLSESVERSIRSTFQRAYKAPLRHRIGSALNFACPSEERHLVEAATYVGTIGVLGTAVATLRIANDSGIHEAASLLPCAIVAVASGKMIGKAMERTSKQTLSELAYDRLTRGVAYVKQPIVIVDSALER